jgi:hypothetical protein
MSRAPSPWTTSLAAASLLLTVACEEDTLGEIHPQIVVCGAAEAEVATCNQPLELGEVFTTVPTEFKVWVRNVGRAPLALQGVTVSSEIATIEPVTAEVGVGLSEPLALTITPADLGQGAFDLVFTSDDPETPEMTLPVLFVGTPPPTPEILLCGETATGSGDCATDLVVDFGEVRRTQEESRLILVRNVGTAPLEITSVVVEPETSLPGELSVVTSTRPGTIAEDADAPVIVRYTPLDGEPDRMVITFESDDPATPQATVVVLADAGDNEPPIAAAVELSTGMARAEVVAGAPVFVDSEGSRDPEGDPLGYAWSLVTPAQSMSQLDDPSAGRVSFVPDRAGLYRVQLVVTDSLGAESDTAVVELNALPEAALRVRLSWEAGGDADIHLVPTGDALFAASDCYFENPRPDLGAAGEVGDDPELLGDAEAAPGVENLVYLEPPDGSYEVWAQYWNDTGAGAVDVRAEITVFDASFPSFDGTQTLGATCDAWHVGTVTFPDGAFTPSAAAVSAVCPTP